MERSAIHLMAKRGKSIRQIANELGRSPTTIARVLHESVEKAPATRHRRSRVDPFQRQIEQWIEEGLTAVRMLELAREDPDHPYTGSRSVFGERVYRIRQELTQREASATVPIRFEGLPGEYLQVDWGEVRHFPFTQQSPSTRYFLVCRLKYSRWNWLGFAPDMRQETLFRGLVDGFAALGWVPWVLVFDNMRTVTSGRDATHQPLWTPALLQFAGEFGFHPQACDPRAANQKGSVESLVRWVKGNFLAGRRFADDADLAAQAAAWIAASNTRPSDATGEPPAHRLPQEAMQGGPLPATARDFGLLTSATVSREALVAVNGNRYSVPVAHVGAPVTVRLHRDRVRIWRDATCLADHLRSADGAHRRVIDPAHFAALFPQKRRAQAMLYRDILLDLGEPAPTFLSALSRRQRDRLQPELLTIARLYDRYGAAALLAAMAQAQAAGTYNAAALTLLLAPPASPSALPPPALLLPDVPPQTAVDRALSDYEVWVQGAGVPR